MYDSVILIDEWTPSSEMMPGLDSCAPELYKQTHKYTTTQVLFFYRELKEKKILYIYKYVYETVRRVILQNIT